MDKKYNQLTQSAKQWNKEEDPIFWDVAYYQKNTFAGHKVGSRERKVLQYLDNLNLKKGSRILELGYGAGVTSAKIYSRGFDIVGVDISQPLCELAIKNCEKVKTDDNKAKFEFLVGNAEKLEFPDNSFDCVVGLGFLHYLEYPDSCVKEVYRVLKTGGYFIITQRNMYGINKLDGPLKLARTLSYPLFNRRYELRWQDTFLIHPVLTFATLASPFSNSIKKFRTRFIKHKNLVGKINKNALSFDRLKKMIEASGLKIIKYDGAGYLTKKIIILFPIKLFEKLDSYLQKLSDERKIPSMYKFGNSVVFLAQK